MKKTWKSWKSLALLLAVLGVPSIAYAATDGFGGSCCDGCPLCD